MDKVFERAAALREAVTFYWVKAQGMLTGKTAKISAVLLILAAVAGSAFYLGADGKTELKAQVRQLREDLAQADERPAPQCPAPLDTSAADQRAGELQDRLDESEAAKAKLQKKVKDYETQLARRHAKGGGFVLSPADARSLSNIR